MNAEKFRLAIESGNVSDVSSALASDSDLANQTIAWSLNQEIQSDPLHYVCDCVFNNGLSEERAGEMATLLLARGARVEGSAEKETPLVGATSLGVESVALSLIEAGANVESSSVFGARPLHWAAAIGLPQAAAALLQRGADIEARCTEYGATPLYWAAQAVGPRGPKNRKDSIGAAKVLIAAGADVHAKNKHGRSALDCSQDAESKEMYEFLLSSST